MICQEDIVLKPLKPVYIVKVALRNGKTFLHPSKPETLDEACKIAEEETNEDQEAIAFTIQATPFKLKDRLIGGNMFTCKECAAKAGQPTNKSRKLRGFKHRKTCSQHPAKRG